MKISHPVYDMLNIMCSDFHGNILKDVEYITKSVRGLVRSFGQCMFYTCGNRMYEQCKTRKLNAIGSKTAWGQRNGVSNSN